MGHRQDVVDTYMDNYFFQVEGEAGVRNLENMCERLGYGQGFMRGRAIEEMLADNPGAVEAVAEFLANWAVRNTEWNSALEEVLEEDRVEIE
jgi:hypothetical protein